MTDWWDKTRWMICCFIMPYWMLRAIREAVDAAVTKRETDV